MDSSKILDIQEAQVLLAVNVGIKTVTIQVLGLFTKSVLKMAPFYKVLKIEHYFVMPLQFSYKNLLDFSEQDFVNGPVLREID